MRTKVRDKDVAPSTKRSIQNVELENQLTRALDESSSNLARRLEEIAERFKGKVHTEHTA